MSSAGCLEALRERYPWPERCPSEPAIAWSMDYGGRRLISDAIAGRGAMVVLEVGSFLGGSARQWLAASPDVFVICIDTWPTRFVLGPLVAMHPVGRTCGKQLSGEDGLYRSFLSSMWDVKDRVIHVRGKSADKLPELFTLGARPDMIYIDSDKKGEEIAICDELFPDAVIGGDDWNWSDGYSYPVRKPVRESAARRGRIVKRCGTTWLIDDRPWSLRERIHQWQAAPRSVAQVTESLLQRMRGRRSDGVRCSSK